MSNNSVAQDALVIDGTTFPAAGESERLRIVFDPTAEVTISNSGDDIISAMPGTGATMTLSCYDTDAAHALMLAKFAKQQSGTALGGGKAAKARFGGQPGVDGVTWQQTTILQQADIVSARTPPTVVWSIRLTRAVRGA